MFEFIDLIRKCQKKELDFIDIFLTRLKQKNNFQILRDLIISKEDQNEQYDVDDNITVQRINELKKYEKPIDDKIFQLEKTIINFEFECSK